MIDMNRTVHVDLSGRGLSRLDVSTQIQSGDLDSVTHLYLNDNRLRELPNDFFRFQHLLITRQKIVALCLFGWLTEATISFRFYITNHKLNYDNFSS